MLPEHVDKRRKQREEIHELQQSLQERVNFRNSKEAEARELQGQLAESKDTLSQLERSRRRHEDERSKF